MGPGSDIKRLKADECRKRFFELCESLQGCKKSLFGSGCTRHAQTNFISRQALPSTKRNLSDAGDLV